jgi:hypothetical protein
MMQQTQFAAAINSEMYLHLPCQIVSVAGYGSETWIPDQFVYHNFQLNLADGFLQLISWTFTSAMYYKGA